MQPQPKGSFKVASTVVGATPEHHTGGEDPNRRDFIHIAATVAAVGAAGGLAWPFIDQMNPAADTLALASVEFDLSKVETGQQVVIKWRGKPLFIRHRSGKEIALAIKDNHADLRDPQTDEERHKAGKAEWLILIGTCISLTFLNPIAHQTNLMVMGPGGYSTKTFVRFGIPVTIVALTVGVLVGAALLK